MTLSTRFDAKQYWETRLKRDYSLGGVGRLNWGRYYNQWQYRISRKVFKRVLRTASHDIEGAAVLDVGSGTGFYIDCWKELGVKSIAGIDLTALAVEKLQAKYPESTFYELDIGDETTTIPGGPYEFVSAMGIMFHIVDDQRYSTALKNICASLNPGGILIFSDLFLHGEPRRADYIVHRTRAAIEAMLDDAGLERLTRRPMYVLMNEPVDSSNRLLKVYWGIIQRIVHRVQWTGFAFGAALYPLELLLVSTLRESPATEVMICRRPHSGGRP